MDDSIAELTWIAKQSLVRDRVFVRQMSLAFGLPLVFLGILMLILSWPPERDSLILVLKIVLVTGGVVGVLYLFTIFGVLRGRRETRYVLDDKGVLEETAGPLKYMNIVKMLLIASGKPTYAGIGMLARGPKSIRVTWKQIQKYSADPQAKTISLRKGRTELLHIRCTDENYQQVLNWIKKHLK